MIHFVIHISEEELEYLHRQGRAARIKIEEYISKLIQEDMAKPEGPNSGSSTVNPSWEIEAKQSPNT